MTLQLVLVLLAVLTAALWLGRGLWAAATGRGCAEGGCGRCSRGGCPVPKLEEALRARPERRAGR